jgi:hypothetical protein
LIALAFVVFPVVTTSDPRPLHWWILLSTSVYRVWAAWHLPLFFYPGWISASPIQYLLIVVGLGVLLAFGANLARFSVIAPILMHATSNTSSRFLNGLFAGTHTEPHPPMPFEMVMGLCGLAVAGVVVAVTRGRLAYRRPLSSLDADYVEHRG